MSVIRVEKTKDYTAMSNYHFKEADMSLKAKGLLSLMLSLPEKWDYSIKGLCSLSKDSYTSVMTGLQELEKFGYLIRVRAFNEKKRFCGYDYHVFEKPQSGFPQSEFPTTEFPFTENQNQLNTKQLNTNKLSTKELKKEIYKERKSGNEASASPAHKYGEYKNVILSDEDLEKLKSEFPDWQQRIERLSEYIASSGKKYKPHLATIRSWARQDKAKPGGKKPEINASESERLSAEIMARELEERTENDGLDS